MIPLELENNAKESRQNSEDILKTLSFEVDTLFIVFGKSLEIDLSNIKSIKTKVIPNIGEEIVYDRKPYIVRRKTINYTHVQGYDFDEYSEGRGKEEIFIMVDPII